MGRQPSLVSLGDTPSFWRRNACNFGLRLFLQMWVTEQNVSCIPAYTQYDRKHICSENEYFHCFDGKQIDEKSKSKLFVKQNKAPWRTLLLKAKNA